jgi:hypothetical protein
MRRLIALSTALALAGCSGTTPETAAQEGNPYPANYRQLAIEYVKASFVDPYSIREAEIAKPKLAMGAGLLGDGSFATPWLVCVRANAKNRLGAYVGRSETAIQVYGGKAVGSYGGPADFAGGSIDAGAAACAGASYTPFPEINGRA